MSRNTQASKIFLSFLVLSAWSCSKAKQSDETPEKGQAASSQNSSSSGSIPETAPVGSDSTAKPGTAPAAKIYTIPELVSKLSWKAELSNNSRLKVFSGFNGSNPFKILVDVIVFGQLPATVVITQAEEDALYDSPEYLKAAEAESPKISLTADPAFVTMNLVEEYSEGRLYELTTVKAGATTAMIKYGSAQISLAIQIANYTAAQVNAGRQRYETAVAGATPSPSCASCHRAATGVDHSPYYMSQYSDAALLSTIELGVNSDDNYQTKTPHKMSFTNAADKAGIVPYLRSLDPNLLPSEQK